MLAIALLKPEWIPTIAIIFLVKGLIILAITIIVAIIKWLRRRD